MRKQTQYTHICTASTTFPNDVRERVKDFDLEQLDTDFDAVSVRMRSLQLRNVESFMGDGSVGAPGEFFGSNRIRLPQ